MKLIYLNKGECQREKKNIIVKAFLEEKVVVILTDTIYGFSCLFDSKKAIKKINKIKNRKANKQNILLISSINMAAKYCNINSKKEEIKRIWQGKRASSIILESKDKNSTGLALRLPKNDFLIKIIRELKKPIVSTSYNFSGKDLIDINLSEEIFKNRKHKPDLIVNSGSIKKRKASSLIDLRNNKKIIRA